MGKTFSSLKKQLSRFLVCWKCNVIEIVDIKMDNYALFGVAILWVYLELCFREKMVYLS